MEKKKVKEKRYRVEVVETKTGKVWKVIGRWLTESQAVRRIATGMDRFDTDRVFIRDVEEK